MSIKLEKFVDKDGNDRSPHKWELKERGYSPEQIKEALLPHTKRGIPLAALLALTFIVGLLLASFIFIAIGIGLHYNPDPTPEQTRRLVWAPISLVPVVLLILGNLLRNFCGTLFLITAVLMGLFWGGLGLWYSIDDPGDAAGYMMGVIYCILIILSVLKIRTIRLTI